MLIIGAGPSGKDLVYNVAKTAKTVILSCHADVSADAFPSNVKVKPDVSELKAHSARFSDGTEDTIDTILYCTGYTYSFPFLSVDTGICHLEKYHIHPLYMHCINIQHPTMALIGLTMLAYTTLIYDMQVSYSGTSIRTMMESGNCICHVCCRYNCASDIGTGTSRCHRKTICSEKHTTK